MTKRAHLMDKTMVRNLRERGMSIRQIAQATGHSKSTISRFLLADEERKAQEERKRAQVQAARANIARNLKAGRLAATVGYIVVYLDANTITAEDIADLLLKGLVMLSQRDLGERIH